MRQLIISLFLLTAIAIYADQNRQDVRGCGCGGRTNRDQIEHMLVDYANQAHQTDVDNPDLRCDECGGIKTQTDLPDAQYRMCGSPIQVTAAHIAPGGVAGGYTITTPGCYVLSDDVAINSFAGTHAVTIDADDVTFDLNGKTITRFNGFGGCFIANNNHNITIQSGTIKQFNNDPLHFLACDAVTVDQMQVLESKGSFAAFFNSCTNCNVTNSNFNDGTFNPTGIVSIVGFVSTYAPSSSHRIDNCSINNNSTTTASLVIGILMSDSPFSIINNCRINNNHITKANMQAIYMNRSNNYLIENTEVASNTCVNGFFDGAFVNLSTSAIVKNCAVKYNRSVFGPVNGIFLNQCTSSLVQDCNVDGNLIVSNFSDKPMVGIRLGSFNGPNKLVCSFCLVDHNIVNENRTYGSGISRGIYALDDGSSSNAVTNNTVTRNTSTTTSIGIDLDGGTNASGNVVSGHLIN